MSTQHHVEVLVSKSTFGDNIRHIREMVAPAKVCVVMKANAYGHGLKGLAETAVDAGADMIGICTNPEAATIRELGLDVPLFRLRMALPAELDESLESLNIEEQVGTDEAADYLNEAGLKRGEPVPVHIKIDTGMGRSGYYPEELDKIRRVAQLPGLAIKGILTHFPTADGVEIAPAEKQMAELHAVKDALADVLPEDILVHTHNSAATVRLTPHRRDMVRVGAACYGVRTSTDFLNPGELKPVMSFKTWVAQVRDIPAGKTIGYGGLFTTERDSKIAALPVGFGEGYPRGLFNKGIVLIHGKRCPVVGRVSLNITTVDITDLDEEVKWGDEAVLIGKQGDEEITFEEMADKFNSVHTEINLSAGFLNEITYA